MCHTMMNSHDLCSSRDDAEYTMKTVYLYMLQADVYCSMNVHWASDGCARSVISQVKILRSEHAAWCEQAGRGGKLEEIEIKAKRIIEFWDSSGEGEDRIHNLLKETQAYDRMRDKKAGEKARRSPEIVESYSLDK